MPPPPVVGAVQTLASDRLPRDDAMQPRASQSAATVDVHDDMLKAQFLMSAEDAFDEDAGVDADAVAGALNALTNSSREIVPSPFVSMRTATAKQVAGRARFRSHRRPTASSPVVSEPSPSESNASKQSAGLIDCFSSSAAARESVARASSSRPAVIFAGLPPKRTESGVAFQGRRERRLQPRSASHQFTRAASSPPRQRRSCSVAPGDGSKSMSTKRKARAARRSLTTVVGAAIVAPKSQASSATSPSKESFRAPTPRSRSWIAPPAWHMARIDSASASVTTT
mmetsp:Transcript_2705/g.8120  ORF Transcript_2705/g.8120 Transcript_2705/m.8120 type:complete len:284 (-) Transcript_2705:1896-2747(-)